MRCFAEQRGYDPEFWGIVGLLHDIDFEQWPEQHCVKAPELLREGGADESIIHAVCSHGWAICVDIKPEHEMEKLLYAADELTGLIGAAALMRPSKSVQDMELKSLKKKYKDKKFAAGCSREVIERGAEWTDARGAVAADTGCHALLRGFHQQSDGRDLTKYCTYME